MDIIILFFVVLILDGIYLYLSSSISLPVIEKIQSFPLRLNYSYAFLCYVFIIFQLYYFIIKKKENILNAFLLGFTTYGIVELTNAAIFKNWDYNLVILDMLWGGILYSLSTYIIYNMY